jgi:hypothetical protein
MRASGQHAYETHLENWGIAEEVGPRPFDRQE